MIRAISRLAALSCLAVLQQPANPLSKAQGMWDVQAMVGPRDSVVASYDMLVAKDGWTVNLPNRAPLRAKILAAGGDSVVFEIGPFASILRAGQTVTTRTVAHFQGDTMTGRIVARFSSGDSLVEKTSGKRRSRK